MIYNAICKNQLNELKSFQTSHIMYPEEIEYIQLIIFLEYT